MGLNARAFERVVEKAANLPLVLLPERLVCERTGSFHRESTNHKLDALETDGAHTQGIHSHTQEDAALC